MEQPVEMGADTIRLRRLSQASAAGLGSTCEELNWLLTAYDALAARLAEAEKTFVDFKDKNPYRTAPWKSIVVENQKYKGDALASRLKIAILERDLAACCEQIKGVACDLCWTTSWAPIAKVEDAQGVNTKLRDKTLMRCEHCWRERGWSEQLAAYRERNKCDNPMRFRESCGEVQTRLCERCRKDDMENWDGG